MKRKALQTVGGGSTTSSGVGGVIKTSTTKERANPLRRVERRSTQRNINGLNKEIDSVRPPQTNTFDFSFKSIPEKSAALAAASVNAASAKRLAAVSPIQTMNSKNDPYSSPLFLQQSQTKASTKPLLPPLPPPPPVTPKRIPNSGQKNGDWICMFCEYRLYYGDGRRRRRPKTITGNMNGSDGMNNNTMEGGNSSDKAIAT
ncbi:5963_t:CDS:2 [Diversispora eburnea]|uniref:5963_t:CDS:1 n=1 Tax=Diversispora eburnea TaxID=1213867 RepID=A0A9N9ATE6_9GLOM|nr:5963_t:CDS:2 [Diversispora eburnea]